MSIGNAEIIKMRDTNDLVKFERYQSEALIYQQCPISSLLGMVSFTETLKLQIEQQIAERSLDLKVHSRPGWYF